MDPKLMDDNLIDRLHQPLIKAIPHYDTDRSYPEGFHQKEPTHPTEEDADRPYPEGFHQMRRPPNHKKSKEETDRHKLTRLGQAT
jgi:hypothetical protein